MLFNSLSTLDQPQEIVAVGGVTGDSNYYFDIPRLGDFKEADESHENDLGGGAGNFASALMVLSIILKSNIRLTVGTKIGKPITPTKTLVQDLDLDDLDNIRPTLVYNYVLKKLRQLGVTFIDTMDGDINSIPNNHIFTTHRQRFIHLAQADQRILQFNPAVHEKMKAAVAKADLVYGHTSAPLHSLMAFSAPKKHDRIPTLLDFSVTKWTAETTALNHYEELLSHTTHIKMGSDIALPGLEPFDQHKHNEPEAHEARADQIIAIMRDRYKINYIAVSNNSLPVVVWDNGNRYVIPVVHVEPAFLLGVGDAGFAMTALSMTKGRSWVQAVHEGSEIATLSARYRGRTWLQHVTPHSITEWTPPGDDDDNQPGGTNDQALALA